MIDNKFLYFQTHDAFDEQLDGGNISQGSIAFIEDSSTIWTHGKEYDASGGEDNVIEQIKVNNTALTPDANRSVNITVPTQLSDLTSDSTHRVVTDAEKASWDAKADADDFEGVAYVGDAMAEGDDPTASFNAYSDTVWNKNQTLSSEQRTQIQSNIGVYSKAETDALIPSADNEDITVVVNDNTKELKLADKTYAPLTFSGLGRKYLRKNIVNGANILTSAMVSDSNTIYHIQYDYDLNGQTLTIPNNCVLDFDGGSISNGVLGLNNAFLKGEPKILCNITGAISNPTNNVTYFGIDNSGQTDCSSRLQYLLTSLESVHFPQGTYLINNQVTMPKIARISGEGQDSILNITYNGYAFVYPYDSSISNNWFRYSFKNISINGDYPNIDDTTSELTDTSFLLTEVGTYPYAMEVVNCQFRKLKCALNIAQAYWIRIVDSYFYNMGDAIIVSACNSSVIAHNMFRGCKGTAITINPLLKRNSSVEDGTLGLKISGNDFSESLDGAIRVMGQVLYCDISGNYFESKVDGAWQQIIVGASNKLYNVTPAIISCSILGNSGMWTERGGIKVINSIFNRNIYQGYVYIDDDSSAEGNIACSSNKESALMLGYVNSSAIANAKPFGIESKTRQYNAKHVVVPANTALILRDISIACYSDFRILFYGSSTSHIKLQVSGISEDPIEVSRMEEARKYFSATNLYSLSPQARNVTLKLINTSSNTLITDIDINMSYNLYQDK